MASTAPDDLTGLPPLGSSLGGLPALKGGLSGLPPLSGGLNGLPALGAPAGAGEANGNLPGDTAPLAAPASHGGGFLHGLGDALGTFGHDVANAPKGFGGLIANVAQLPIVLGEKGINEGIKAVDKTGYQIGNENPYLNAYVRGEPTPAGTSIQTGFPALFGIAQGEATLGQHLQGAGELATGGTLTGIAPSGAAKATVGAYEKNPVNATLSDVGTLAMDTGVAGALAPEAGAAEAALDEGVEGPVAGLTPGMQIGNALRGTSEIAGKVATAPLQPYLGLAGVAGNLAPDVVAALKGATPGLQDAIDTQKGGADVREAMLQGRVYPEQLQSTVAKAINGFKGSDTEFGAGTLRAIGQDRTAAILDRMPESPVKDQVMQRFLAEVDGHTGVLSPDTVREALNPSENTLEAERIMRSIGQQRQDLQLAPGTQPGEAFHSTGFGTKPGQPGLSPEQVIPELRQSVLDREMAKSQAETLVGKAAALDRAEALPEALPSLYRTQILGARGVYSDLESLAKDPENWMHANDLQQVLNEVEPLTHIEGYQRTDIQAPTYLRGNGEPDETGEAKPGKGLYKDNSAAKLRTNIGTAFDKPGAMELERQFYAEAAFNRGLSTVVQQWGKTPEDAFPGQDMAGKPGDISAAMARPEEGGLVPVNLQANSRSSVMLDPNDPRIDENTTFLPKPMAKALVNQFPAPEPSGPIAYVINAAAKGFDALTQVYRSTLGLSPHFAVLRAVGDSFISSINNDQSLPDIMDNVRDGAKMYGEGEARGVPMPASLSKSGLNDTTAEGNGIGDRITRASQAVPRAIDKMTRASIFVGKLQDIADDKGVQISDLDPSTPEYAQAVTATLQAVHALDTMEPVERNVFARIVPSYPWLKSIAQSLLGKDGFVARSPATAALIMNLGRYAAAHPNEFKLSPVQSEFDPTNIFSMGTSGINPVIRAAAAAAGFDLSTRKDITRPTDQGGLTTAQRLYAAENQFMPTKIGLNTPLSGLLGLHPLSPLNQNISRYQSGDPRLPAVPGAPGAYGGTEPSYLPAWHGLGSYVPEVLGIPTAPRPQTAAQTAKYAKDTKTTNKNTADYHARKVAAAKRGIH